MNRQDHLGVAISTRNRRDVFTETFDHWHKHLPDDTSLVVVDDASDEPIEAPGVTVLRNEQRQGVAGTKNRGIAALIDAGCTHLFLSDDDCYPANDNWWEP